MRYAIVTPAYNEGGHIAQTLESVCRQTVPPVEWIIVNDRCDDRTGEIVADFARTRSWIRVIEPTFPRPIEYGARVAAVVMHGVEAIQQPHDLLMKLDADVSFAPDFCERLIDEFRKDDGLGITSGRLVADGQTEVLRFGDNTRGATKLYRRTCFDAIGGIYLSRGWDLMDDVAARCRGWRTRTSEVPFHHLKPEGRRSGLVRKHYYTGLFNGRVPYDPWFFALKVGKSLVEWPPFAGAAALTAGYVVGRFFERRRPFPADVSRHLRQEQRRRLTAAIHR